MSTIYKRITGQVHGDDGIQKVAVVQVNRGSPILENSFGWDVGISRLIMKNIKLPLFDPSQSSVTIYFQNISTSTVTSQLVNFAPLVESDGYIYDYQDVAAAINNAFAALSATLSIVDVPTFTFNPENLKFTVNTVSAFRSSYKIAFDSDLYSYMPSFDYESVATSPYYLDLSNNGDTLQQYTSTIELISPVASIAVKSDLPASNDLLPPPFGSSSDIASVFDEAKYLIDFDVQQTNNQAENLIRHSAKLNEIEWRNITSNTNITNFYLKFYWIDYKNNSHLIYLDKNSVINAKIIFQSP